MEKVKFTQMKDGDKEDYELLTKFEENHSKARLQSNIFRACGGQYPE